MVDLYGHETCTNTVASVSNGFEWGIGCCHGLPSLRSLTTPKQPKAWGPQRLRKKTHCWCKVIVSKFPSISFHPTEIWHWLYWFLKVQFSFQIWNIWTKKAPAWICFQVQLELEGLLFFFDFPVALLASSGWPILTLLRRLGVAFHNNFGNVIPNDCDLLDGKRLEDVGVLRTDTFEVWKTIRSILISYG